MVCVIRHFRERSQENASVEHVSDRVERAIKRSPFLSTEQAAFYLGCTDRTLEKMRQDGRGPIFRRHGRFIRYHIDDLDDWSHGLTRFERGK